MTRIKSINLIKPLLIKCQRSKCRIGLPHKSFPEELPLLLAVVFLQRLLVYIMQWLISAIFSSCYEGHQLLTS